ncbi:MAG: hypothetical protein OXJ62_17145 [Spirochaetaceae bacterium]|nr:hypothetical protein [Spirochaetaceae bacterium]
MWGVLAGAITQTIPALTFITIGMVRTGILTPSRAFPILIGGNIGAVVLLLVVSFDIKLAVLYALGASQLITLVATRGRSAGVANRRLSGTAREAPAVAPDYLPPMVRCAARFPRPQPRPPAEAAVDRHAGRSQPGYHLGLDTSIRA